MVSIWSYYKKSSAFVKSHGHGQLCQFAFITLIFQQKMQLVALWTEQLIIIKFRTVRSKFFKEIVDDLTEYVWWCP
jgi:hypothetical protein